MIKSNILNTEDFNFTVYYDRPSSYPCEETHNNRQMKKMMQKMFAKEPQQSMLSFMFERTDNMDTDLQLWWETMYMFVGEDFNVELYEDEDYTELLFFIPECIATIVENLPDYINVCKQDIPEKLHESIIQVKLSDWDFADGYDIPTEDM